MIVLVVGASGVVGSSLCKNLEVQGIDFIGTVHDRPVDAKHVSSDIEQPLLGIEIADVREVTHIVYCAGSTRFDLSLSDARKANTIPVHNLIALADKLPRLKKVVFTSSVYSCGLEKGRIPEDLMSVEPEFANTYEQSKYEAENIILSVSKPYDICVARLSTIVSSDRGEVAKYDSIHRSLQYVYLGLVGVLPGEVNAMVDIISSDYASRRLLQILSTEHPYSVYHVAAGEGALTIGFVINRAREIFEQEEPGWSAKGYPTPIFTSYSAFQKMGETLLEAGNIIVGGAYKAVSTYARQLCFSKVFDTSHTDSLGDAGVVGAEQLFDAMVHYCLSKKWK